CLVRGSCRPPVCNRSCGDPAMHVHHLDGGYRCLEALVSCLYPGAVQCLLQCLAGQNTESVRHAGLLLGLTDAATHLVVDRLVMGRFAAQQTAECDHTVETLAGRERSRCRRNLPRSRHSENLNLLAGRPATQQTIESTLQQAIRDDRIPAC